VSLLLWHSVLVVEEDIDGPGLRQRVFHGARITHVNHEDADILARGGADGLVGLLEVCGVAC
jgi:hypothetical protein